MYKIFSLILLCAALFYSQDPLSAVNPGITGIQAESASSQILSTNDLRDIESLIDQSNENTLVLWDVDQTLITPEGSIFKPKWDALLDQWLGGKKMMTDKAGNKRYVFRELMMSVPHSVVDSGVYPLIEKIKKKQIPMLAFTAAVSGKVGKTDSFIDWRIDELKKFGFDFSHSFPNIDTLNLSKDPNLQFPPVYKSGVLVTSLHEKGPVLIDFLKAIQWMPRKIIFVDDQLNNVHSVIKSLEGQVEVIGVHYTAVSEFPCELNEESAHFQVDHFLKTGEWVVLNM